MQPETATIVAAAIGLVATVLAVFLTRLLERQRHSAKEMFYFWRMAFDRQAFKGPYTWHSDQKAFKDALEATIKAINTGVLLDRNGNELHRVKGKGYIKDSRHRQALDKVVDALEQVRGLIPDEGPPEGLVNDRIDFLRDSAVSTLNEVFAELDIPALPLPTATSNHYDMSKSFAEG